MLISEEDYHLSHIGQPRRSGRYPWGSGENPYQRNKNFLGMVDDLAKKGMTQAEIARALGLEGGTNELRAKKSIAVNQNRMADITMAQRLRDRGWGSTAIGKRMGIPESTVRSLLAPGAEDRARVLDATASMLKREVDAKGLIDVGVGTELSPKLGVSNTRLNVALAKLKEEGYEVHNIKNPQVTTGHLTQYKVLAPPGTTRAEVWKNRFNIKQIDEHTDDGGRTWVGRKDPVSVDSKRIKVAYAEDGGADADGVIYLRPGVDDISLGGKNYAQVRVAVDGTHFLKGMAMYKPDLPKGVDIVFNTNKTKKEAPTKHDAMKPLVRDKDGNVDKKNPFGSQISRQTESGVMHILSEEGSWDTWSKTLSSQILSKQSPKLAKEQLDMRYEQKKNDLEVTLALTNPTVRRTLLESIASDADSSAVHLEAAHLPRQANRVLLPVPEMKPTEVYAPGYRPGERVVLIRHPHGGTFEIPELVVNNKNPTAKKLLGNAPDAIGINPRVAQQLSGADFDGDTVIVIPNNQGKIKTSSPLAQLKNFDHVRLYKDDSLPPLKTKTKDQEMGKISNLITDMTIQRASHAEIARAIKHSMVVIDAQKHNLNYKQSALDNNIPQLKEKYQGGARRGASTLVSLAGSQERVPERKQGFKIDPKTGEKLFKESDRNTWVDSKGKVHTRMQISTKMAETKDAHTLSSGTPIEKVYADHANRLKSLANLARREQVATKNIPYSPSAKEAYANEVASLESSLRIAKANAPRERQAQLVASAILEQRKQANPGMDREQEKKARNQALAEARVRTGASKTRIQISPSEWDAIQAGAISNHKLEEILRNTDLDQVKKYATPRNVPTMTPAKLARAKSMAALGYTQADIADHLGVSVSTITTALS